MSGAEPSSSSRRVEAIGEEEEPTRRTRGIRGGRSAKRRRDAYIRHQSEQQLIDPLDVPVVHQGGQQRPLYTPKIWSPAPSEAEEEDRPADLVEQNQVTSVSSEEETVAVAQPVRPVWLGPRPRVPSSGSRDNSRTNSVAIRPAAPVSQQYLKTEDLPGVRVWRVGSDFIPREIWLEEVPVIHRQGKLIAVDWHQVSDVCIYSGRRHIQAADNGQVPADVATFYQKVNRRLRSGDLLVIISHIERSEDNLRRVLRGVRQSRLPASFVFITERRAGVGGKAEVVCCIR